MSGWNEKESDVYGLITQLCKHTLRTYNSPWREMYTNDEYESKTVKCLRAKAFEILLHKTDNTNFGTYSTQTDPLSEILKFAFALKLGLKRSTDAELLENLSNYLLDEPNFHSEICPTLQFLLQLKSFESKPTPITNIFLYGKTNRNIPEAPFSTEGVPPFQAYPIESFLLSEIFEVTLGKQRLTINQNAVTCFTSDLHFSEIIESEDAIRIESIQGPTINRFISDYAFDYETQRHMLMSSLYGITKDERRFFHNSPNKMFFRNGQHQTDLNYAHHTELDLLQAESGSTLSCHSVSDNLICSMNALNNIWYQAHIPDIPIPSIKTWERLGFTECMKEKLFASDIAQTAIHLFRINEAASSFALLSGKAVDSLTLSKEVSAKEFIKDIKSLLLGIESHTFDYNDTMGFVLKKNRTVYGVSPTCLKLICHEPVEWGNCFRYLTDLVTQEPYTGKLQQEGLIFQAMCTSIKEVLAYYRSVLLRIFTDKTESTGLLGLLGQVRSVAALICQVARLCGRHEESRKCFIGEGNGILTHIYREVTQVTEPRAAFVIYSILKSCCEVYFRFLQKWLFEGLCDDVYGEFMIKTRPQYLRIRGHKFWTKSFSVCTDAVPGFLHDLTHSILQCGKTVRLLRICDPKNPVCSVFVNEQPEIKVCLSVSMLREQFQRCAQYEKRGYAAISPVISISSVIKDREKFQRESTELIACVSRSALTRIEGERVESSKKTNRSKQDLPELLEKQIPTLGENPNKKRILTGELKEQQEKRFLPEKEIEQEPQMFSRDSNRDRAKVLKYYEDLTIEIEKRQLRSKWRARRMRHYGERVEAIAAAAKRGPITDPSPTTVMVDPNLPPTTFVAYEDENRNFTDNQSIRPPNTSVSMRNDNNRQKEVDLEFRSPAGFPSNGNQITTSARYDNILECYRMENRPSIERPTTLIVTKADVSTTKRSTETDGLSKAYDMTPNNNEVKLEAFTQITNTFSSNSNQNFEGLSAHSTDSLTRVHDSETPMSCTTDHFTSSIQSPSSQLQNTEDCSPTGINTEGEGLDDEDLSITSKITSTPAAAKEVDHLWLNSFDLVGMDMKSPLTKSIPSTPSLTLADVETIDHTSLQVYLEKSIRIPVMMQTRLVNHAIIKYFLKEHDLLLHLHSLRSYFFLLNGEFAKCLTDSLYARLYEISAPLELFNSATLTNLLERAFLNSFNNTYVHSELLSLSAIDTPLQLPISDPSALDCLSLNYKVSWPLNIILDETVMQQYGKVFKFLITSGRVSWVLQEDFNMMKRDRQASMSVQYHKLQLYRHSMTQFMNALHNYLTCSVLHASWAEFQRDLEQCSTVDQIYFSHVNYIKRILSRCMLNTRSEKMRLCLTNIFKVILKFHNQLRSQHWVAKLNEYVHPNFKRLEQIYQAFCELRAYMSHVAFKLATSGYQPHLMHFLNALNINPLYQFTVKSNRRTATGVVQL